MYYPTFSEKFATIYIHIHEAFCLELTQLRITSQRRKCLIRVIDQSIEHRKQYMNLKLEHEMFLLYYIRLDKRHLSFTILPRQEADLYGFPLSISESPGFHT